MKGVWWLTFYHRSPSFGNSCMHSKFQNRSTFPSGRKVMSLQSRKKLTYENNGHLSFPETRLPKPTLVSKTVILMAQSWRQHPFISRGFFSANSRWLAENGISRWFHADFTLISRWFQADFSKFQIFSAPNQRADGADWFHCTPVQSVQCFQCENVVFSHCTGVQFEDFRAVFDAEKF